MITTQKEIQELIDRENKLSPFAKLKRWLIKFLIQAALAFLITLACVWFVVAFTDFKLPFLYSENKVEYQKLESGAVTRTTRKKVVIDFKPRITESGIVIKEGKK